MELREYYYHYVNRIAMIHNSRDDLLVGAYLASGSNNGASPFVTLEGFQSLNEFSANALISLMQLSGEMESTEVPNKFGIPDFNVPLLELINYLESGMQYDVHLNSSSPLHYRIDFQNGTSHLGTIETVGKDPLSAKILIRYDNHPGKNEWIEQPIRNIKSIYEVRQNNQIVNIWNRPLIVVDQDLSRILGTKGLVNGEKRSVEDALVHALNEPSGVLNQAGIHSIRQLVEREDYPEFVYAILPRGSAEARKSLSSALYDYKRTFVTPAMTAQKLPTTDHAMGRDPGGIDFNSANLAMVIKRDGHGVPLPLSQQDMAQLSHFEGLDPVILSIKPASQTSLYSELQINS